MELGFWEKLKKPFCVLAPMAGVTDAAFRRIIAKYGKPDVMWTEFVSCDGLMSRGREMLLVDLEFANSERPIVAQIFGARPENFYKTALLLQELGFDGIDINMGCPDRNVEKQGAGAALIKNPELAKRIIQETKRGAGGLPVSVKTRIGYNKDSTEEWVKCILDAEPAVITVHARTRKEMSDVPANWDAVRRAVEVRNEQGAKTLIMGNGDVKSLEEARMKASFSGADGVMIGRGIFGNPWLFGGSRFRDTITPQEKMEVLLEHTKLYETLFRGKKNFTDMKKHYKAYVVGFDGARELREELMKAEDVGRVERVLRDSGFI